MRPTPASRRAALRFGLLALLLAATVPAAWMATLACGADQPISRDAAQDAAPAAQPQQDIDASLAEALAAQGWVKLPRQIGGVRYSGPTPSAARGSPPGPVWFVTT